MQTQNAPAARVAGPWPPWTALGRQHCSAVAQLVRPWLITPSAQRPGPLLPYDRLLHLLYWRQVSALPCEPAWLGTATLHSGQGEGTENKPQCWPKVWEIHCLRQKRIDRHKLAHELARPGRIQWTLLGRLTRNLPGVRPPEPRGWSAGWRGLLPRAALCLCPLDIHFLPLIPHKTEVCAHCLADLFTPLSLPIPLSSWGPVGTGGNPGTPPSYLRTLRASVHLGTRGRLHRFYPTGGRLPGS